MKPRDVRINAVLNGWVVAVGCQKLVFTNLNTLLENLKGYLENPKEAEEDYMANAVNAEFFNDLTATAEEGQDQPETLEQLGAEY